MRYLYALWVKPYIVQRNNLQKVILQIRANMPGTESGEMAVRSYVLSVMGLGKEKNWKK
jgi:hypothetical protein